MKLAKLAAVIILTCAYVRATTVTGTIQDANGNKYANGTVTAFSLITSASTTPVPTDANGSFSITLPPSTYYITVCAPPVSIGPTGNPTPKQVCTQSQGLPIVVSGTTQDVSTQLNAVAPILGPSVAALLGANNTFTGSNTFTNLSAQNFDNVRYADQFSGLDCGAKVNAADTNLGATAGTIVVTNACGQSIATAINISANHVLFFMQGGFTFTGVSSTITLGSNSTLMCTGRASTLLNWTSQENGINAQANVTISGCDIRGPNTAGSSIGINSGSSANGQITNNTIEQWGSHNINLGGNSPGWNISNNIIQNGFNDGILCPAGAVRAQIVGNYVQGNGANGIDLNCADFTVTGNTVFNNGTLLGGPGDRDGLVVQGNGGTIINGTISGNTIYSNFTHGIRVEANASASVSGIAITGNTTRNNGGDGIILFVTQAQNGVMQRNIVAGNNSHDNTRNGVYVSFGAGATGTCSSNQITGNQLEHNATGLTIDAGCVDTYAIGNTALNNTTANITDNGTRTTLCNKTQVTDGNFECSGDIVRANVGSGTGKFIFKGNQNFAQLLYSDSAQQFQIQDVSNNSRFIVGLVSGNPYAQAAQFIANLGTACTNGELALSAGWQSTGSATVTAVAGTGQTCSWTITTGTTTAANPTITDTLTNALPSASTVCWMNIYGGTHTAVAGESLRQTTFSATAPVFTANFTPTANGFTYFVTRGCGP